MSSKSDKILAAAFDVFTRYGVQKATMGDIAKAAGVARQTLYNTYGTKETVMEAVVRSVADEKRKEITGYWAEATEFEAVLNIFCTYGTLAWYDHAHESPYTEEFMEYATTRCQSAYLDGFELWKQDLAHQIGRFYPAIATDKLPILADFIFSGITNTKQHVPNRDALKNRLDLQTRAILAILATDPARL